MKKNIILAASALCIVALSNAQANQKQYGLNGENATMAVHTVTKAKNIHTTAVTIPAKNTYAAKQATIKRKHHKKTVHPRKLVDKK